MLTDERPANWHDDDYIRAWAIARGLNKHPKALVALMSVNPEGPDTAEVDFGTPGNPVRRFKMRATAT